MAVRSISQARAELSALIKQVQNGQEVIITKAGKPVARIVRCNAASRRREPGALAGQIHISADFDVLPKDIGEAFN